MCRIVTLSDATKLASLKSGEYAKLVQIVHDNMADQRDGFGAANQLSAFKTCRESTNYQPYSFTEELTSTKRVETGSLSVTGGPLLLHGRISTNIVDLASTHPFELNGFRLIHNGVIDLEIPETELVYKRATRNDSELLINLIVESFERVSGDIKSVNFERDVMSKISGYAAITVIMPDGKLIVARDDRATLSVAWSEKLKTFIYATNSNDLKGAFKIVGKLKWFPFKKNTYCVFNGNDLIDQQSFKITAALNKYQASSMGKSLGYSESYATSEEAWPYSTKSVEAENEKDLAATYGTDWRDDYYGYKPRSLRKAGAW